MTNDWGFDLLVPQSAHGPARASHPPRPLLLPRLHSRSALLKLPTAAAEDVPDEVPEDVARALGHEARGARRVYPYGLRPTLLFPLPVYPLAIALDLVLRLTWSAKLSSHLHAYADGDRLIFGVELAEVVRRWMWVFLRVEWETVRADVREPRTRSPPPGERRDTLREPIFEHEEFEMVAPSEGARHKNEVG